MKKSIVGTYEKAEYNEYHGGLMLKYDQDRIAPIAGVLFDKHGKDQIESFIYGDKVYWWFSDAAIKTHSRDTLVLKP